MSEHKYENRVNCLHFVCKMFSYVYLLRKGIKGFNVVIFNKANNKSFVGELIHAIIETSLSILLVFDPFEKVEEHIIILGIEMIIMSLKVAFYNEEENEQIGD